MHPFDEAIRLDPVGGELMRGRTHPGWSNMVGPFGGITAAVLTHAVEIHPDAIGEPLALTVNFAAPVADGDFEVAVRAARTNRSNQHWTLELRQDGEVKTTATAVTGIRRDTWADTEAQPPSVEAPERFAPTDLMGSVVLWARNYDMRFAEGPLPDDGQTRESSTTTWWLRDRAQRRLDYPGLAALGDAFYPRVFLRRGGLAPAGTISLTMYFHADQQQLDALRSEDFLLGSAYANRFSRGYFDQTAHVWSADAELLASSHQLVYFKA
ncbi:MAG: thioesterase family protein [Mycobacterium sp.]|nr:thioesterase family protein [Mycobacterium sp.]